MLVRPFGINAQGPPRTLVRIPSGPLSLRGIGMKPVPFDYQAPATLREAISLLSSNPEAAVIAGGQSLMPVLAFRLATPSLLVDLRRIQELAYIGVGEVSRSSFRVLTPASA